MSLFVRYPRMSRISFLARLRAAKYPAFEFAFRLEPIVQIHGLVVRRVRDRFGMRDV